MDLQTIQDNHTFINAFFDKCTNEKDFNKELKEGKICLGVEKGDRLVVVDNTRFSKVVNFFKNLFGCGVSTNKAKVETVFNLTEVEFKKIEKKGMQDAYSQICAKHLPIIKENANKDQEARNSIFNIVYEFITNPYDCQPVVVKPAPIIYDKPVEKNPSIFSGKFGISPDKVAKK